ncbi:unnamed protein product [Dicrocoelium dendriticum]|nr:unnamed protein product [Dicrocoelium dendriticum]
MGQRSSALKVETNTEDNATIREIKIIYEDVDDSLSRDRKHEVNFASQKKVSFNADVQSDRLGSDRASIGIQFDGDEYSTSHCFGQTLSLNSLTQCTVSGHADNEPQFTETQCTNSHGSLVSQDNIKSDQTNKSTPFEAELIQAPGTFGSEEVQKSLLNDEPTALRSRESCNSTKSTTKSALQTVRMPRPLRHKHQGLWHRILFSSQNQLRTNLNKVESGLLKVPMQLTEDNNIGYKHFSTKPALSHYHIDDGNFPNMYSTRYSYSGESEAEIVWGDQRRSFGADKFAPLIYDKLSKERSAPNSCTDVVTHSLTTVPKDWDPKVRSDHALKVECTSPRSAQPCSLSVTANSPIRQRGNIERLTMFTLKPDPITHNSKFIFVDDRIFGSSMDAKLLPECLQLVNPSKRRCHSKRCSHKISSTFTGGNMTIQKRATKRQLHSADFVKYTSADNLNGHLTANEINLYSYQFWIQSEPWVEKAFKSPMDRRIESIGRVSDCRIRLTNKKRFSPRGFHQRMVSIIAPSADALVKCCKLFDDKFPNFYATSGVFVGSNCINDLPLFVQSVSRKDQSKRSRRFSNGFYQTNYQRVVNAPFVFTNDATDAYVRQFPSAEAVNSPTYFHEKFSNLW